MNIWTKYNSDFQVRTSTVIGTYFIRRGSNPEVRKLRKMNTCGLQHIFEPLFITCNCSQFKHVLQPLMGKFIPLCYVFCVCCTILYQDIDHNTVAAAAASRLLVPLGCHHHSSTWFTFTYFSIMGLNFVDPSNMLILLY